MKHKRRENLRYIGGAGLAAVIGDTGVEIFTKTNGELVDNAPAKTKNDRAQFTGAVLAGFQPRRGRDKVFGHLLAVDGSKCRRALFVVARIPADRSQPVRSKCHVTGLSKTPGDILDIWI